MLKKMMEMNKKGPMRVVVYWTAPLVSWMCNPASQKSNSQGKDLNLGLLFNVIEFGEFLFAHLIRQGLDSWLKIAALLLG